MSADRVRAARYTTYPLDRQRSLLYSSETGRVEIVDHAWRWVLGHVQGFRELDRHAQVVLQALPVDGTVDVREGLAALARAGLLRSTSGLESPALEGRTPVTTIAVITADRPAYLRRSLDAIVRHCETFGHRPRLIVIDGSRQAAKRTATRTSVTTFARSTGRTVQYVGAREAADLHRVLAGRGLHVPLLRPGVIGVNRNILLLLTAGEHVLSFDDDVICRPWDLGGADAGLIISGHHQGQRENGWFRTRAEALAATTPSAVDLVAAHGVLLGRSLAQVAASFPSPPDLQHACQHLFALPDGSHPTVRVTFMGLAGDVGTYCPHRVLFNPTARPRFWADEAAFRIWTASREILRVSRSTVVTHDCGCLAPSIGLANSTMLPPFAPIARNEDGVFGTLLSCCDRTAVFGHLPIGIVHDSPRASRRSEPAMQSARESRVSELLIALIERVTSAGVNVSPATRLRRMGEAFGDLADLAPADLVELVTETTLHRRSRELEEAGRAAEVPECPAYWRRELDQYRATFLKQVRRRDFFLPVEFHGRGSTEAGYRRLQAFFRDFGTWLTEWPTLWDAARDMNASRDRRVSRDRAKGTTRSRAATT